LAIRRSAQLVEDETRRRIREIELQIRWAERNTRTVALMVSVLSASAVAFCIGAALQYSHKVVAGAMACGIILAMPVGLWIGAKMASRKVEHAAMLLSQIREEWPSSPLSQYERKTMDMALRADLFPESKLRRALKPFYVATIFALCGTGLFVDRHASWRYPVMIALALGITMYVALCMAEDRASANRF